MRVRIGRTFTFEAAHMLPNYPGKCKNLHGHTYKLEVEVESIINGASGMVMDFKDLKQMVEAIVIDTFDHSYLNDFFPNPTAENMIERIYTDINMSLAAPYKLSRIRLWETPKCYVEVQYDEDI